MHKTGSTLDQSEVTENFLPAPKIWNPAFNELILIEIQ
jgi:hypothetical protein